MSRWKQILEKMLDKNWRLKFVELSAKTILWNMRLLRYQ
jgi:capsular polysaccharide biosynthesis protein